jgi:hypothetical protein
VTAPPPLSLLDEQLRLAFVAACEALAAAPGALYPVVYVGPLRAPDLLRGAMEEAARTFGVAVREWGAESAAGTAPALLLCGWGEAVDAATTVSSEGGVQLVVWGDLPADALPDAIRECVAGRGGLVLDPRDHPGPGVSAWLGGPVERVAGEAAGAANPLVVVAEGDTLRMHADQARMHLEALGLHAAEVTPANAGALAPQCGDGFVGEWTGAVPAAEVASLALACRAAGSPLVLAADPASWNRLRADPAWAGAVGSCTVVRAGGLPPDSGAAALSWPRVSSVWVGAPGAPEADDDALVLPDGATLLEGLGHLEVRGRPGRLVAWGSDRAAAVEVDQRAAGAVVVGVRIVGRSPAADRETVLAQLDEIRGWEGVQMALVAGRGEEAAPSVEETVQRVGFFFSRMDDERASPAQRAPAHTPLGLHAVASTLVGLGLSGAARALLRRAERESRWGVEEEILLGFLVAEGDPEEAVTRLRHAALRLATAGDVRGDAWVLQTDATLNALLLMVRARQVGAADAWASVDGWLRQAGTVWVSSPRHAAVLFELAARAGHTEEARRFAELFRGMAGPDEPLAGALAPALRAVVGGGQ